MIVSELKKNLAKIRTLTRIFIQCGVKSPLECQEWTLNTQITLSVACDRKFNQWRLSNQVMDHDQK